MLNNLPQIHIKLLQQFKVIQKAAEMTGYLIVNKIAEKQNYKSLKKFTTK